MALWQTYHIASSIEDALVFLEEYQGRSKIIAGGTDLLVETQQGQKLPFEALIDITKVPEMNLIEVRGNKLFIGAAVTHTNIAISGLVKENCRALAIASGLIGGTQVRNIGTIGGNIAHALPAADGTIALMAMDAKAEIATLNGKKIIPLQELFVGPGKSSLDPDHEILIGLYIDLSQPNQSSTFKRIMRPQGVAIAILNLALWVEVSGKIIEDIRIAVGPSGPVPQREFLAEDYLRGLVLTAENIKAAHQAILDESTFRTSKYRSTKEYREKMVGVLLEDALIECLNLV